MIYIIYFNLHLQENLENINCIGGWLPWRKTGEKTCCQKETCKDDDLIDNEMRTYKIIQPVNTDAGGINCEKADGDKEDISCNNPKPDDCLAIRARYYGFEDPSVEQIKERCNMGNCIPAENVTANCDGKLILIDAGTINENVGKRCPWICDPKKYKQGDGINTCLYDSDCAKCSPKNLFDRTNCGNKTVCPNPLAEDGCGIKRGIDDFVMDINDIEDLDITEDKKYFKKDYSKYIKPKKKDQTYNKYNLKKPEPPSLYKALYDYIPFNAIHSFF